MISKKRSFALLPKRRMVYDSTLFYCLLTHRGWYWGRVVTLTYNVNHGWLAFSDDNDRDDCARDVFWDVVGTLMVGFVILLLAFLPEIVHAL